MKATFKDFVAALSLLVGKVSLFSYYCMIFYCLFNFLSHISAVTLLHFLIPGCIKSKKDHPGTAFFDSCLFFIHLIFKSFNIFKVNDRFFFNQIMHSFSRMIPVDTDDGTVCKKLFNNSFHWFISK